MPWLIEDLNPHLSFPAAQAVSAVGQIHSGGSEQCSGKVTSTLIVVIEWCLNGKSFAINRYKAIQARETALKTGHGISLKLMR